MDELFPSNGLRRIKCCPFPFKCKNYCIIGLVNTHQGTVYRPLDRKKQIRKELKSHVTDIRPRNNNTVER